MRSAASAAPVTPRLYRRASSLLSISPKDILYVALPMITGHLIAAAVPTALRAARHWMFHLGGIGLIPLGLLDNSPIPLPGIMDVATILLAGRQQKLWIYYAVMATAGSVIGGFVTYRLARKAGKKRQVRFTRRKVEKVCQIFERWASPRLPFRLFAAARADGAVHCGRCHAISCQEIPACADAWANLPIPGPWLSGRAIWAPDHRVHRKTRAPRGGGNYPVIDCRSCGGVLLLEWKQEKEAEIAAGSDGTNRARWPGPWSVVENHAQEKC